MSKGLQYREAARVHLDVSPERARELVSDPDVLQALDGRLAARDVTVVTEDDQVRVEDGEGRIRLAFRVTPDGEGTRLAASEAVRPEGVLEHAKWMLSPRQAHREFETELQRLRHLVEALDSSRGET